MGTFFFFFSEKMCLWRLLLALLEKHICIFFFASGVVLENYLSVLYRHTLDIGLSSQMAIVVLEIIFTVKVLPIHFVIIFVKYD